jgi:hypothetical protein
MGPYLQSFLPIYAKFFYINYKIKKLLHYNVDYVKLIP